MSKCRDCGCDLPSLQTVCSRCYDAKYAGVGVGRPNSLLESVRQFGSNPRRRHAIENRIKAQPWWLAWCFAFLGLGLDWRCAFEWFAGKSSFYAAPVLGRNVLIVLACAGVALLVLFVTRELRWRYASPLFCLVSGVVYNILSIHWVACRAAPYNC